MLSLSHGIRDVRFAAIPAGKFVSRFRRKVSVRLFRSLKLAKSAVRPR